MALQVVGGTCMVGKSLSLELESLLSYLILSRLRASHSLIGLVERFMSGSEKNLTHSRHSANI